MTLMPNHEELEEQFKPKFIARYSQITDFEEFKKYSLSYLRRSIRVNTLKISVGELKKRLEQNWNLTPVPWCEAGFWIEHKGTVEIDEEGNEELIKRRDLGNLPEHSLGYIYVQEAASMIPPVVLDPKPGETVLDMCASPGSKTTQIAMYMENKGLLMANDYQGIRMKPLGMNMQRCGVHNDILTLMQGQNIRNIEFDKILVDAPCSGTGTIRKSLKTLTIWNPAMVQRLCRSQKTLLETGFNLLKKGGTLVYSTCSCEPEENEGVVSDLLSKFENADLEDIDLPIKRSESILEFEGKKFDPRVKKCLRIFPQDNDTEGFFVTKITKR
jgi:tRNA (cytosine49-C5)-methyltransferase